MTANHFAALLDGVRRYSYHDYDEDDGFCLREKDVLAALAAAVPADLAEAGNMLEGVTPSKAPNVWRVQKRYSFICHKDTWQVLWDVPNSTSLCLVADTGGDTRSHEQDASFIAWARNHVPALIATVTAQAAQIKGLEAERDRRTDMHECAMGERDDATLYADEQKARAEAAETALAAERAKVAKLVEALDKTLIAKKANDAREVFSGTCDTAKQAIDYLEQLILAALATEADNDRQA